MKKIYLLILFAGLYLTGYSQHIVPVEISTDPQNIEIAIFGAATADGGTAGFLESLNSKGDVGFVLNALVRKDSHKNGIKYSYKQFIVNFNPVIMDWSSLDLNTISKTSIDSFSVQRMPFAEDCLLHIGFRNNTIAPFMQGGGSTKDQKQMHSIWADLFYRPYSFDTGTSTYGFQTFNFLMGYQYSFFKTNVPVINTFLMGLSPQFCYMAVNEAQADQNTFRDAVYGKDKYAGQNFVGFGAKLTVQVKHFNIFIDGRQYFAADKDYAGNKFSSEPNIVVGAFMNLNFYTKAPVGSGTEDDVIDDNGWE